MIPLGTHFFWDLKLIGPGWISQHRELCRMVVTLIGLWNAHPSGGYYPHEIIYPRMQMLIKISALNLISTGQSCLLNWNQSPLLLYLHTITFSAIPLFWRPKGFSLQTVLIFHNALQWCHGPKRPPEKKMCVSTRKNEHHLPKSQLDTLESRPIL